MYLAERTASDQPTKIIKSLSSEENDLILKHDSEHAQEFLKNIWSNHQWLACDCLPYATKKPLMTVRHGKEFFTIVRLTQREQHHANCKYLFDSPIFRGRLVNDAIPVGHFIDLHRVINTNPDKFLTLKDYQPQDKPMS